MQDQILLGDSYSVLSSLPSDSVQCCVTSPPYWGLRDYGVDGQLGLEKTPDEYVANLRMIFEQVKRVLKPDGTLWLNLGDSYCGGGNNRGNASPISSKQKSNAGAVGQVASFGVHKFKSDVIKPKDLVGIPWRVAFALQADGWYLRQDIIWHKPNPMPESVRDRCTKAHEYIFLLSKSQKYFYDADAVMEPLANSSVARLLQTNLESQRGSDRVPGKTNGPMKAVVNERARKALRTDIESRHRSSIPGGQSLCADPKPTRNRRSVWSVTTKPFKGAHFATFPPDLIEPCILAGSRPGDTVLDPFFGAGTTGLVASKHGRHYIGIEINESYIELAKKRLGLGGN